MYLSVSVRIVEASCKTKLNVPVEEFIGIVKQGGASVSGVKNGFDLKLLGDRTFSIAAREKGSGLDKFDVAFFTASCDTAETNQRYAKSLQLDYPILSDPQKKTARTYGVVNDERPVPFRWTYIIGVNGKILHVDKQVNAKSHGADLVKKLKELGVREK